MKEEKLSAEKISIKSNRFLAWFDNFWYHYKWHTIVALFLVIVLGVSLIQACTTEKTDIVITYAGPKSFVGVSDEKMGINSALSEISREAYGDEANATLNSFLIYSKEQIEAIEKENYVSESERPKVNTADNTASMNNFNEYLKSGASYILLLDPSIYEGIGEERFIELREVFGSLPAGARDKYSVRLGDTSLYQAVPELRVLPADTVVCMHARLVTTKQDDYDMQKKTFASIAALGEIEEDESAE